MKVAVVYHEPDPQAGGYFTIQNTVVEALRRAGSSTGHEFVYYSVGPAAPADEGVKWLPETKIQAYRGFAGTLARSFQASHGITRFWRPSRLDRALQADSIELVWFVSNHVEDSDLPFIFTVWDIAHRVTPWFPEVTREGAWEGREQFYGRYLPRATKVIVPNAAGAKQVEQHYRVPLERQLLLGHPTPSFAIAAAREPSRPVTTLEQHGIREPYLLYPAQLWPHKNHAGAMAALRELTARGGDYRLLCVGSEPGSASGQRDHLLQVAAEMGITDRVHFVGFVALDELVALYQHAFALLYLSFFGPENLPPLEAFALDCPVVYGDVPGAREQLGDAAQIVDPTDASAIADAVVALESAEARTRYIEAGRARADEMNPERYVRGVLGFIDEFAAVRRCWR